MDSACTGNSGTGAPIGRSVNRTNGANANGGITKGGIANGTSAGGNRSGD